MTEPYAPGSKEWWLVRQIANGDERRSWYELTDEDRASLRPPVVYVIMGNDFPDCVFSNKEAAEKYITTMNNSNRGASTRRIYWRIYEFPLMEGVDIGEPE